MNNTKAVKDMGWLEKNRYLKKARSKLVQKMTPHEAVVMKALDQLGVKYTFQKPYQGSTFADVVDFYLKRPYHAIIEVDGESHFNERAISKDSWRTREIFKRHGHRMVRMSNEFVDRHRFVESMGVKQDNFGLKMFQILRDIRKLKNNGTLNFY